MAKQRLNTNLIALLTTVGMVLVVVAVGVATWASARRDPAEVAKMAEQYLQAGDSERAAREYMHAFNIDHEAEYLIECARIQFQDGAIQDAMGTLRFGNADQPTNVSILEAILGQLWALDDVTGGQTDRRSMRDFADRLLKIEPDHVLALISSSAALSFLKESDRELRLATERFERARELDPENPRVVLAAVNRMFDTAAIAERAGMTIEELRGDPERFVKLTAELQTEALQIMATALEARPNDPLIVRRYAQISFWGEEGARQRDEAIRVLAAACEAHPEDPDLRFALGTFLARRVAEEIDDLDVAERDRRLDEAKAHLDKTLEIEPAMFEAYGELASIELLRVDPDAELAADQRRRYQAALNVYGRMVNDTATLVSLRSVVGQRRRAQTLYMGFNEAMSYYSKVSEPAERETALEIASGFTDAATVRYPELPSTLMMSGTLAIARNEQGAALQVLTQLFDRTADTATREALTYNLDASRRLAFLHRQRGQLGEAQRYVAAALRHYDTLRQPAPLELLLIDIESLLDAGRAQEAYDRIAALLHTHPDERRLLKVQAVAAERLGNRAEAQKITESLGDATSVALQRARWALAERDFATAESVLLTAIEKRPDRRALFDMLTNVMLSADRRAELQQILQERLEQTTDEDARRVLEGYLVVASVTDEDERDARLREIIERDPDLESRFSNLFNYCMAQGEVDEAAKYLDELEAYLRESKVEQRKLNDVMERQFLVAIERGDTARASNYAAQLAEHNVDLVNGARYRGILAISQRDGETAIRELRVADQDLPPEAHLKTLLAQAYLMVKPERYEEAVSTLEDAIRINPTHARALSLLFKVKEITGFESLEQRRDLLRRAFAANRRDPYLAAAIERLVENENPRDAIAQRERIRAERPEDLENIARLIGLYMSPAIQDPDGARAVLTAGAEVARQVPAGPETRVQLQPFYRIAAAFYANQGEREAGEALLDVFAGQVSGADSVHVQILRAGYYEQMRDVEASREALRKARAMLDEAVPADERADMRQQVGLATIDFLSRTGQVEDLVDVCRDVLAALRDDQDELRQKLRLRVVETMAVLNDEQAAAEVDAYLRDYPDDYRVLALRARVLLMENRLEDARLVLTRVLELNPDFAPSRFARGGVNLDLRRFDDARADLLEAKRLAPNAFEMRHRIMLAQLYEMQGETELAEAELLSVLDNERTPSNIVGRVSNYLLRLYRKIGNIDKADDMITQYGARQPDNPFWPYQRGMLLMERGEQRKPDDPDWYAMAVRPLQRAVELTEYKSGLLIADWLRSLTMAGRPSETLDAFNRLTPEQQTPLVQVSAAEAYAGLNQKGEAGRVLTAALSTAAETSLDALLTVSKRAIEFYPESQGKARHEMVRDLIALFAALIDEPGQSDAKIVRFKTVVAESLSRTGSPEDAVVMLDEALALAPPDAIERVTILLGKAQALSMRGDPFTTEIRKLYEDVLAIDEDNALALNNLAYLLASNDKAAEALPYAERLRTLKSESAATWDTIGVVFMKNERWDDAQAALQRALMFEPENTEGNLHMGQVLAERGLAGDARRYLERARDQAREEGRDKLVAEAEAALETQR